MGRESKATEDRKTSRLQVCLTAAQRTAVVEAAKREGLDASAWARRVLLAASGARPPDIALAVGEAILFGKEQNAV